MGAFKLERAAMFESICPAELSVPGVTRAGRSEQWEAQGV
jgi:hypothetical protein